MANQCAVELRPRGDTHNAWCVTHNMWIDKSELTFEPNPDHEKIIKRERANG